MYQIPVIFFAPGIELHKPTGKTASQVDIMPTILGLLNYKQPFVAFGNNLFSQVSDSFAVNYTGGSYQIIQQGFVLQFDGEKSTALFKPEDDPLLKNNLLNTSIKIAEKMEQTLKAYIQQYNNRMIDNNLAETTDDGRK